jgi:hypothetical protein
MIQRPLSPLCTPRAKLESRREEVEESARAEHSLALQVSGLSALVEELVGAHDSCECWV